MSTKRGRKSNTRKGEQVPTPTQQAMGKGDKKNKNRKDKLVPGEGGEGMVKMSSSSSLSWSLPPIWIALVVGLISLALGIFSPTFLSKLSSKHFYGASLSSSPSSSQVKSEGQAVSPFHVSASDVKLESDQEPKPTITTRKTSADSVKEDPANEENQVDIDSNNVDFQGCSAKDLSEFLYQDDLFIMPGYHVVCWQTMKMDGEDKDNHCISDAAASSSASETLGLRFYEGGFNRSNQVRHSGDNVLEAVSLKDHGANPTFQVEAPLVDGQAVRSLFEDKLKLRKDHRRPGARQPWAVFSTMGERLFDANDLQGRGGEEEDGVFRARFVELVRQHPMVLVFQGGQFLWPGIRLGFQRSVQLLSLQSGTSRFAENGENFGNVTLETISLSPLVLSVEGFLTDHECEYIQKTAEPTLRYSGVVLMDKDAGRPASDFRTSQTTFLRSVGDDVLSAVDYRTASLVRIPRQHQEEVQVLRYGYTEKYDGHIDAFDPNLYKKDSRTLEHIKNGGRNRLATVFWYLSTVEKGGETVFPRHHGQRERSMKDCETGLRVKPVKGKVIIFYSLTGAGYIDEASLHGACPVREGIKWAGNKWVWNEPMRYLPA